MSTNVRFFHGKVAPMGQKNDPEKTPPLDTLGQLDHPPTAKTAKNLCKRARSKWFTSKIVAPMIFLESPMKKYYQRAFFCGHKITQNNAVLTSKYCDTRICHVCARIRTAKMIKGYLNQLTELGKLEFVTLTLPNVAENELKNTVEYMNKTIINIIRSFRRKGEKISGIRKLEITYNSFANTYHPHFHIIVNSQGNNLVDKWLKCVPNAKLIAQDVRDADENSINELFKYTTKIVARNKSEIKVYINALDKIITAIKGKRCIQPFGIIKKVDEEVNNGLVSEEYEGLPEYDTVEWLWNEDNWYNVENGEMLTSFTVPDVNISVCK
jgi:hypothetical protein